MCSKYAALLAIASCALPGCAALQQLDDWSRPKIRYIDPREIGPDGLPDDRRKGFVNKFIIWSEVPVSEFYSQPYYTSGR